MSNSEITIEGSVATWILPATVGVVSGDTYTGRFRFRCFLLPVQELACGREYREYLGANGILAPEAEGRIAFSLTQLKYRVLDSPPFWRSSDGEISGNIADWNIVSLVLDAAVEAEELFKKRLTKERDILLDQTIKATEEKIKKGSE